MAEGFKLVNRAFNLTAAAKLLEGRPDGAQFVNAVKKFQSAVSVSTDLDEVKQSIDELRSLKGAAGKSAILRALLVHAVIVYSRATHTSAVDRYNVGVTGAYSAAERKLHRLIVDLRDKSLAHFGSSNGWYTETVLYLLQPGGDAITAVHQRTDSDSIIFDGLDHLLGLAIPYVGEKVKDRALEIDAALASSPQLFKVIDQLPFDVEEFYGPGSDAAKRFWQSKPFVHEETIVREVLGKPAEGS